MTVVINGTTGIDTGTGSLIAADATTPTYVRLFEDTDNGANYVDLIAPTSVASNKTITLPDATGTMALTSVAGGMRYPIQPISASVAGNALTVTLNPTTLDFRSSTLGSGTVNTRTVSSAITMMVSSGSTLGTINNTASRIVVLAIDNAGTVELAVVNISGGNQLDETNLISTTAEGGAGAADSKNVIYSTTARSSVPYRVVGFVDSTQTTAGTWATAPSTIQGVGGQALSAMSSLGYGQTYQNVIGSRSTGTTYYNTTGKPITIVVSGGVNFANTGYTYGYVDGNLVAAYFGGGGGGNYLNYAAMTLIVPPGSSYSITSTVYGVGYWYELR